MQEKETIFAYSSEEKKVLLHVNMNFSFDFSKFLFRICQSHHFTPAGDLYRFLSTLGVLPSSFPIFDLDSSLDDNS